METEGFPWTRLHQSLVLPSFFNMWAEGTGQHPGSAGDEHFNSNEPLEFSKKLIKGTRLAGGGQAGRYRPERERSDFPMDTESQPILQYLDIFLRRKWLIVIPSMISLLVALYVALVIPPLYQSETTILVEPQQIPEKYVQSTVTGSVQDRLNIISQQILSRTNLESVIQEFNLYPEARETQPMEEVLNAMRKNISVDVIQGGGIGRGGEGAAAAFKLAFSHANPEVAQQVTMKLASMYITENLKIRENLARETRSFLDKQLLDMEGQLKTLEEAIRVFKQSHTGELPEQLEANLRTIEQLQVQRSSLQESLRHAESGQISLDQQLAETPRYLLGGESGNEGLLHQIESKKQELTSLMTRFTDQYPDVIRLKKEIGELEGRMVREQNGQEEESEKSSSPMNPLYLRVMSQANENLSHIRGIRNDIAQTNQKMKDLQQRVENAPKREQELMGLTRDYETIKKSYDSLMERKINASIAESLESRQKSEQFRVLDPANIPQKRAKPDRWMILGIGLLVGLGIGAGITVLLEFFNRSFRKVEDIKSALDLPLLGVIPVLVTDQEMRKGRMRGWLFSSVVLFVYLLLALTVFRYAKEFNQLFTRLRE
jgi:polysaccharide chain length determinant protein (PEP-CTERM system associated)